MSDYFLCVNGTPAPQGSKNFYNGRPVEASKRIKPWREAIVAACMRDKIAGLMIDTPISVSVDFLIARPKAHYKSPEVLRDDAPDFVAKTPDIDKLLRGVYDSLTIARVIKDDALIVSGSQSKVYVAPSLSGANIHLSVLG